MRLKAEEKIIFRVHPHWLYVAFPEFVLIILGAIFLIFAYTLPAWVLIVFVGAWTFAMLMIFLDWLCINYYLTNLRLIEERGIIGKRIMFIPLDKVQDISCKFGILGRIFGFGDLEIESASAFGKIVFSFIANPRKRKEQISKDILKIEENRNDMEEKEVK
jgi:uncharacterized membrane protein YdbT with pleckstrin-like domain